LSAGSNPPPRPVFEPLGEHHDRAAFQSGSAPLDRYLHAQAGQDARRRVAAPFVLVLPPSPTVIGYYTLSNASVRPSELPPATVKRLPRYPTLPATLLGRLAVDRRYRNQGFGRLLLVDALRRSLNNEIASIAVLVDAQDEAARQFCLHYEFLPLQDQPNRLSLPMSSIAALFSS
jgi:predicted GNAT family N-acyltransferase